LSQHWLTVADLVPLLYVLPCAVMMFMCMKGSMNNGQQTDSTEASARTENAGQHRYSELSAEPVMPAR
jgi:hypothetical protein